MILVLKLFFRIIKTFFVPFLAASPKFVLQLSLENVIIFVLLKLALYKKNNIDINYIYIISTNILNIEVECVVNKIFQ